MNANKRNGNRWTVNELLSLQREYELLEWNVQQIAEKHQRTERAILFRLESEGIITSWNDARGFDMESYKASMENEVVTNDCVCNEETSLDDYDEDDQECCDNDSEYLGEEDEEEDDEEESVCDDMSEVEKLSDRVWSLETTVTDIKDMIQHMFNNMVSNNQKKTKSLRKQMAIQH